MRLESPDELSTDLPGAVAEALADEVRFVLTNNDEVFLKALLGLILYEEAASVWHDLAKKLQDRSPEGAED